MFHSPLPQQGFSPRKLQYWALVCAGVIEFLFMILGSMFQYISYYYAEYYLLIPAVVFAAASLVQPLPGGARRIGAICLMMVLWFFITQSIHRLLGMEPKKISTFLCMYLLCCPYAAVTEDGSAQKGLKLVAGIYVAAATTVSVYAVLLLGKFQPDWFAAAVTWDGTRLQVLSHPNIAACLLLIGICFAFGFLFRRPRRWVRLLLALSIALQFLSMVLTNCRTSVFVTCALFGALFFFRFYGGGWKRFVLCGLAALGILAVLFAAASSLYAFHRETMIADYTVQQQEQPAGGEEDIPLEGNSSQRSLTDDLSTLNGRTYIWTSALQAMRDDPSVLLWGTEYVGTAISVYNPFPVVHSHNSWVEVVFRMGLPGLILVLILSWIGVRSSLVLLFRTGVGMWEKTICLTVICVLLTGMLEPSLFSADVSYHFLDFAFLLCLGYVDSWYRNAKQAAVTGKPAREI